LVWHPQFIRPSFYCESTIPLANMFITKKLSRHSSFVKLYYTLCSGKLKNI
jgi:hypothetical protein